MKSFRTLWIGNLKFIIFCLSMLWVKRETCRFRETMRGYNLNKQTYALNGEKDKYVWKNMLKRSKTMSVSLPLVVELGRCGKSLGIHMSLLCWLTLAWLCRTWGTWKGRQLSACFQVLDPDLGADAVANSSLQEAIFYAILWCVMVNHSTFLLDDFTDNSFFVFTIPRAGKFQIVFIFTLHERTLYYFTSWWQHVRVPLYIPSCIWQMFQIHLKLSV